jgi:uncharacterized membrane protein
MEEWFNPWVIVMGITGVMTVIFGFIFLRFPPKRINWFYGYRTSSSMKSQERWDFAQKHSAKGMIRVGLLMIAVGLAGGWLPLKPAVAAFASIPVMLIFIVVLIYQTERALKEKFGKAGNK